MKRYAMGLVALGWVGMTQLGNMDAVTPIVQVVHHLLGM